MRKIFLLVFVIPAFLCMNAQKDTSALFNLTKPSYKYVGIQANLLLQQFLSFNSNSGINTNPYIFTYSKSNMLTGNGFGFGTGFNVSDNSSNDGVSSIRVQNANFSFRFGYEKKYLQRQRLIPFWGVDLGFGGTYNKTVSRLDQSFNSNTITTETTKVFFGPAFRSGLLCALSKHVLLGTEFFFNTQVAISSTNGNNGLNNSGDFIPFNVGFQAPTALFLIFRY